MPKLRPATVITVASGFVAGAIGGAIALHPGTAPAREQGNNPAFHQPVPREFRSMLSRMQASNVETTVNKLVSFGTRQTLSSMTDPNRGIGAARQRSL
ncbi:MAG TPA: hypothetical protein VH279_10975 [Solirubrobacteraceae bacterium]|jgi:hypothetical protein|nr:hypothetical protein [Solirubrobacteraceae bacterium]